MKKLTIACLLLAIFTTVSAEEYKLTVDQAIEIALKNNITLQNEQLNLETLKRDKDFSFNDVLPSLNMQTMFIHQNTDQKTNVLVRTDLTTGLPVYQEVDLPDWSMMFNIQAQWNLSPATFMKMKSTVLSYQIGQIQYEDAVMKLEKDIKKAFNSIYLMKQSNEIFKENLITTKERYENALISYNNGFMTEVDLLQIQSAYESLKPALIEQENAYDVMLMNFKILLGIQQADSLELIFDIKLPEIVPVFNTEQLLDQYLMSRADIIKMQQNIESVKLAKKTQLTAQLAPALAISVGYQPVSGVQDGVDLSFADTGSFSIALSIPVGNYILGNIPYKAAADMDDQIKTLENSLTQIVMLAEFEIRKLDLELKKIKRSLEAEEINVKLAKQVYEKTEEAYNDGNRKTYLELEEAQTTYLKAQSSYLAEQINLLNTIADLEYALNECLEKINCEVKNEK